MLVWMNCFRGHLVWVRRTDRFFSLFALQWFSNFHKQEENKTEQPPQVCSVSPLNCYEYFYDSKFDNIIRFSYTFFPQIIVWILNKKGQQFLASFLFSFSVYRRRSRILQLRILDGSLDAFFSFTSERCTLLWFNVDSYSHRFWRNTDRAFDPPLNEKFMFSMFKHVFQHSNLSLLPLILPLSIFEKSVAASSFNPPITLFQIGGILWANFNPTLPQAKWAQPFQQVLQPLTFLLTQ